MEDETAYFLFGVLYDNVCGFILQMVRDCPMIWII